MLANAPCLWGELAVGGPLPCQGGGGGQDGTSMHCCADIYGLRWCQLLAADMKVSGDRWRVMLQASGVYLGCADKLELLLHLMTGQHG